MPIARCILVFIALAVSLAAENVTPALERARQALNEGVSTVALEVIKQYLETKPSTELRREAQLLQGEALLLSGNENEAVRVLGDLGKLTKNSQEAKRQYLLGVSLAELGNWELAVQHFKAVPKDDALTPDALLGQASALRHLGDSQQSLDLIKDLTTFSAALLRTEISLDTGDTDAAGLALQSISPANPFEGKAVQYLQARLALESGDASNADTLFGEVLKDHTGLSFPILQGAASGQARARMESGAVETAAQPLESILSLFRNKGGLEFLFAELSEIYAAQQNPSDSDLVEWQEEEIPGTRRALATFYLAIFRAKQGRMDDAAQLWNALIEELPESPLSGQACLELARNLLNQGQYSQALEEINRSEKLKLAPSLRAGLNFLAGRALFLQKDYDKSLERFAASESDPDLLEKARFNSALIQLERGNYDQFLETYKQFSTDFASSPLRQELVLEEGMVSARKQLPDATKTLEVFVRDFPEHPRVADAWISMAELTYLESNLKKAAEYLDKSGAAAPTETSPARAAYLRIILAEAEPESNPQELIDSALQWLINYTATPLRADVRMKLGELYFQSEDYLNAQTQFQTVATEFSGEPIQEKALFLAGLAAIKSRTDNSLDTGIKHFEQVFRLGGPLKLSARLEQAGLKARAGMLDESLVLYDTILSDSPATDVRMETLLGKAEALYNLAVNSPERYAEANVIFSQVATEQEVSAFWRNQALWKMGRTLEKMGKPDKALLAYYEVLESPPDPSVSPEFFWFYKCGFDAGRLLEDDKKWESAVALYASLGRQQGPRAEEALQREQQLRLNHFLWSD